jgi:photosynthetic reaction center H subunit
MIGDITGYMDVAQMTLYAFWLFFLLLVLYLHRENKREGYPLETDDYRRVKVVGFPGLPDPHTYEMLHGADDVVRPGTDRPEYELKAKRVTPHYSDPFHPTGDPLVDGVGPAAWAVRPDFPDLTFEGEPKVVPMRVATDFKVAHQDPDPRGKEVLGLDNEVAATVTDLWVDRSEPQVRYLEIEVKENGKRAMIPLTLSRIRGDGTVKVHCLRAAQFANMPTLANPDQITLQEEDRVCAYVGGGTLYGTRERTEPLL